jgi:hypothetical protein
MVRGRNILGSGKDLLDIGKSNEDSDQESNGHYKKIAVA